VAGLSKIQFVANTAAMTGKDAEGTHNGNLQLSVGKEGTTFDTQPAMSGDESRRKEIFSVMPRDV